MSIIENDASGMDHVPTAVLNAELAPPVEQRLVGPDEDGLGSNELLREGQPAAARVRNGVQPVRSRLVENLLD